MDLVNHSTGGPVTRTRIGFLTDLSVLAQVRGFVSA
ncbi:hypothetical protein AB0442_31395 [Kitasatospora sp. NPDC085895]